jgi:hypothetical protein
MNQSSLPNYIKKLRTINLKTKLYKNITIKKLKKNEYFILIQY